MFCNLGYKNMGYKNTYTLREREREGYKNKGTARLQKQREREKKKGEKRVTKTREPPWVTKTKRDCSALRLQKRLQKLKHHILVLVKIELPIQYQILQHEM